MEADVFSLPALTNSEIVVNLTSGPVERGLHDAWNSFVAQAGTSALHCDANWVKALGEGFRHEMHVIHATRGGRLVGVLPLAFVSSTLFGRFLVSLPYVNWAGVVSEDEGATASLVDRAVQLADDLDVQYLELRHGREIIHPKLTWSMTSKVQMRLHLAGTEESAWKGLRSAVRTQVRKSEKQGLVVEWGGESLLGDFYGVFATNMRDLGTPVFGRRLFRMLVRELAGQAEFCVLRSQGRPVAGSFVVHTRGLTEVPSASVLHSYRSTAANSLMYWHMIRRAVERGQEVFDFGRSTIGSSTYDFKVKWGAKAEPAIWQYYVRSGTPTAMRPDGGKYDRLISLWKRLPVPITRLIGPAIVRGVP